MSNLNSNLPWHSGTATRRQEPAYRPSYAQAYTAIESYERLKKFLVVLMVAVVLPSWTHAAHSGGNAEIKASKHKYMNVACANEIDLTAAQQPRRVVKNCKAR